MTGHTVSTRCTGTITNAQQYNAEQTGYAALRLRFKPENPRARPL